MWLDSELSRLKELFATLQQPPIETVLKTDDLESIENLTSIELAGLKNALFIPQVCSKNYDKFNRFSAQNGSQNDPFYATHAT